MTKFGLLFLAVLIVAGLAGTLRSSASVLAADGATGLAANRRLTALNGACLFGLLLGMAVTVALIEPLLAEHYLIGFLMIPPLGLKLSSTGYRLTQYYLGATDYRLGGAPPLLLRFLVAPVLVISTGAVFVTGLELWIFGQRFGPGWSSAHTLSAVVFVLAIGLHLLAHSKRSTEAVTTRSRDAFTLRSLVVAGLLLGGVLAATSLLYASPFPSPSAGR